MFFSCESVFASLIFRISGPKRVKENFFSPAHLVNFVRFAGPPLTDLEETSRWVPGHPFLLATPCLILLIYGETARALGHSIEFNIATY